MARVWVAASPPTPAPLIRPLRCPAPLPCADLPHGRCSCIRWPRDGRARRPNSGAAVAPSGGFLHDVTAVDGCSATTIAATKPPWRHLLLLDDDDGSVTQRAVARQGGRLLLCAAAS